MRISYFQNLCGRFVGSCGEQTPVWGDGNAAHLENRIERAKNISPVARKIAEYARLANTERLRICLWCSCMEAGPLPGRGWRGLLSRLARALAVPSVGGPVSRRGCRQIPARSYAGSHLVFQRTACSWLPGGRPRRTRASRSCGGPGQWVRNSIPHRERCLKAFLGKLPKPHFCWPRENPTRPHKVYGWRTYRQAAQRCPTGTMRGVRVGRRSGDCRFSCPTHMLLCPGCSEGAGAARYRHMGGTAVLGGER
jgi:hypothetical protein